MNQSGTERFSTADAITVVILFGFIVGASFAASQMGWHWADWRAATCMPDMCFCEGIRDGSVRQPANTWSNMGFVLVGLIAMVRGRADMRARHDPATSNLLLATPSLSMLYGMAVITVGLGSFFYHASLSFVGQFVDVMGMYLVAVFIILYGYARVQKLRGVAFVATYLVLIVLLCYALWTIPVLRRFLFGGLLVIAIGVEQLAQRRTPGTRDVRYFWGALGSFVLAFGIWITDITKFLCAPGSLLQGHAIWHFLNALSIALLYYYYRSEQSVVQQDSFVSGGAPL